MYSYDADDFATHVETALGDVLGYRPTADEDLGALDSLQRLEVLVILEERTELPVDDALLAGDWWANSRSLIARLSAELAVPEAAEQS